MKNKFKYLISLLLSLSLTSCNSKTFAGINKVNIAPNTVMGVEITDEVYDVRNVSFDLYIGFSDVSFEYDVIYGVYITQKPFFAPEEFVKHGEKIVSEPSFAEETISRFVENLKFLYHPN